MLRILSRLVYRSDVTRYCISICLLEHGRRNVGLLSCPYHNLQFALFWILDNPKSRDCSLTVQECGCIKIHVSMASKYNGKRYITIQEPEIRLLEVCVLLDWRL